MSENPSVAIIIPTLGRDGCVKDTLRDLDSQNYNPMEVWLVDQNAAPLAGLADVIKSKKLIHEQTKPLGSHGGRNHAIFKTHADILIFVDDDVRLESDFVSKHVRAHLNCAENLGVVVGKVIQPKDGYSEEEMRLIGRLARYDEYTGRVSGNFIGNTGGKIDHIHECNFSAKSKILKMVGGFNEAFEGNAYFEGADLGARIKRAGFDIVYDPSIALIHLQERAGGNRVQRKSEHTYWMMRNQALLNSIYMKKIGIPYFIGASLGYTFAKAIKNSDPSIAIEGLRGLIDGSKYFLPGANKLKLRKG